MYRKTGIVLEVTLALILLCGLFLTRKSEAQLPSYVKIGMRSFNEREVRQTIPLSYGRFVTVAENRMYFVDEEQTIRVIPIRSDSMLDSNVYIIKRSEGLDSATERGEE